MVQALLSAIPEAHPMGHRVQFTDLLWAANRPSTHGPQLGDSSEPVDQPKGQLLHSVAPTLG